MDHDPSQAHRNGWTAILACFSPSSDLVRFRVYGEKSITLGPYISSSPFMARAVSRKIDGKWWRQKLNFEAHMSCLLMFCEIFVMIFESSTNYVFILFLSRTSIQYNVV